MNRHLLFTLTAIMLTGVSPAIAEEEAKRINPVITGATGAETTLADEIAPPNQETQDIILSLQASPKFSTLATALTVSGLTESLSQEGPFTIFAPTNEAFEALPKNELEALMKPENRDDLISLLSYHVISGAETTLNIPEGISEPPTVQGTTIIITKSNKGITVDGANVTDADIPAANGVIHAIDKVITP